jgi:hypothetical protein
MDPRRLSQLLADELRRSKRLGSAAVAWIGEAKAVGESSRDVVRLVRADRRDRLASAEARQTAANGRRARRA